MLALAVAVASSGCLASFEPRSDAGATDAAAVDVGAPADAALPAVAPLGGCSADPGSLSFRDVSDSSGVGLASSGWGVGHQLRALGIVDLDGLDGEDLLAVESAGLATSRDHEAGGAQIWRTREPRCEVEPGMVRSAPLLDGASSPAYHALAVAIGGTPRPVLFTASPDGLLAASLDGELDRLARVTLSPAGEVPMAGLAAGDVDGDGDVDIAFCTADGVTALLAPLASAVATRIEGSVPCTSIWLADLDADGIPDLLTAGGTRYADGHPAEPHHPVVQLGPLLGAGLPVRLDLAGIRDDGVLVLGDFLFDGRLSVLALGTGRASGRAELRVFDIRAEGFDGEGDASGLEASGLRSGASASRDGAVGDLDLDGALDVLLGDLSAEGDPELAVLQGSGSPGAGLALGPVAASLLGLPVALGGLPHVAMGDVDLDGDVDVLLPAFVRELDGERLDRVGMFINGIGHARAIRVELSGRDESPWALGAEICAYPEGDLPEHGCQPDLSARNTLLAYRQIFASSAQSDGRVALLGVGSSTRSVALRVVWPSVGGERASTDLPSVPAGSSVRLRAPDQ